MKKLLFFTILILVCRGKMNSQTLVVMDSCGNTVPYVAWLDTVNGYHLISDSKGEICLEEDFLNALPDTTLFCLRSMFYKPQCLSIGEMRTKGKVLVEGTIHELSSIMVLSHEKKLEMVEDCASFFADNYARDYVAPMTYFRRLYSGKTCTRLDAMDFLWASFHFTQKDPGKWWDDRNSPGRCILLDAYVSRSFIPGSCREIPTETVMDENLSGKEYYWKNYVNGATLSVLFRKRALEIYSPLNKDQVRNFDYGITILKEKGGRKCRVISFKTKPGAFPSKTRIYGGGRIWIDENGFPFRIEIENLEDRYTNFVRETDSSRVLLTPYIFRVDYAMYEGRIYTQSISQDLRWEDPVNIVPGTALYHAENNPYRHPFKNKISTCTEVFFDIPCYLSAKERKKLEVYFGDKGMSTLNYSIDTINTAFWHKKLEKCLWKDSVIVDLVHCGGELDLQAETSSKIYPMHWTEEDIERHLRQNMSSVGKSLFEFLFGYSYLCR